MGHHILKNTPVMDLCHVLMNLPENGPVTVLHVIISLPEHASVLQVFISLPGHVSVLHVSVSVEDP